MKTTKKTATGVCIFLLFFQAGVYAERPASEDVNHIATRIVERLDRDVALTDSQKVVILEYAKVFAIESQNTRSMTNTDAVLLQRKSNVQEYKKALDTILTDEQKETLILKQEKCREAVVKKYTLSKELNKEL